MRQSVLLTGATGDLGNAIAQNLVSEGYVVLAGGRNEVKLNSMQQELGQHFIPFVYDVNDDEEIKATFKSIHSRIKSNEIGPLVGLVNNAGIMRESALTTTTRDLLLEHLNTNFISAFVHMQIASRIMIRNKMGSIVNILSQVSEKGSKGLSAYAASKSALSGATLSLAKELGGLGVRVNGVAPGFIDSKLTSHFDSEAKMTIAGRTALKRIGTPAQVANAVTFLISDKANYITGHILSVDGLFEPE